MQHDPDTTLNSAWDSMSHATRQAELGDYGNHCAQPLAVEGVAATHSQVRRRNPNRFEPLEVVQTARSHVAAVTNSLVMHGVASHRGGNGTIGSRKSLPTDSTTAAWVTHGCTSIWNAQSPHGHCDQLNHVDHAPLITRNRCCYQYEPSNVTESKTKQTRLRLLCAFELPLQWILHHTEQAVHVHKCHKNVINPIQ